MESTKPGELLNQDAFYGGTLKGVGQVYVQVVIDVFCSLAFAEVYTSKMPVTACELLHDRVLPFYEALGVAVGAILTDDGRGYCGKSDSNPYELLLVLEDIEQRTTKVRSPWTNGFVERMNRTLLDECFRVKGRTTWYLGSRRNPERPPPVPDVLQSRAQPPGTLTQGTNTGPGTQRRSRR